MRIKARLDVKHRELLQKSAEKTENADAQWERRSNMIRNWPLALTADSNVCRVYGLSKLQRVYGLLVINLWPSLLQAPHFGHVSKHPQHKELDLGRCMKQATTRLAATDKRVITYLGGGEGNILDKNKGQKHQSFCLLSKNPEACKEGEFVIPAEARERERERQSV